MYVISRTAQIFSLSAALATAIVPVLSTFAWADEAVVIDGSRVALPTNTRDGFRKLVHTLTIAGADAKDIAAARSFEEFVWGNPDLLGAEVSALDAQGRQKLTEGLANGTVALQAIQGVTNLLASQAWLQKVDSQFAARIREQCGRRFLQGRDLYTETAALLRDPDNYAGDPVNLLEDVQGVSRECIENLAFFGKLAAEELQRLDKYIDKKKAELAAARAKGDQAAVDRIEAEIDAAEDRQEEIKKGIDLASVLEILAGLGAMATAVAGIISSGGSCVPCYTAAAAAGIQIAGAIDKLNDTDTVITPGELRRPGITPSAAPTAEVFKKESDRIDADPRYTVIPPEKPGGNFIITWGEDASELIIFQIEPEVQVTLSFDDAGYGPLSATDIVALDELNRVTWTQVMDPIVVTQTEISLRLAGTVGDVDVLISFDEKPPKNPVIVTIETN